MSQERVGRVLDAAYVCFTRHGLRKTTMDDIAVAAGMSRPAVYQYVRGKDDAFRRLGARIFGEALARARTAAATDGTLAARLDRILGVQLAVTQQLTHDTPYAGELLSCRDDFDQQVVALLAETIVEAAADADLPIGPDHAREVAELVRALARGLEVDARDPGRSRERLRSGVALIVAGLAAASRPR